MSKHGFLAVVAAAMLVIGCSGDGKGGDKDKPSEGSGQKSGSAVKPVDTTPVSAEAGSVQIHVPGMSCPMNCLPKAESTLAKVDGVSDVKVDFSTKTATCTIDPETFKADAAIEALAEVGLEGSTVRE